MQSGIRHCGAAEPAVGQPFAVSVRLLSLGVLFFGLSGSDPIRADDKPVSFNRDIRPILADACFQCHGPDGNTRKADLRLDIAAAYDSQTENTAVIAGDVEGSELYRRITSTDPKEVMPPPETNKQITAEQKALIAKWIEQGAKFQRHWAFEPIEKATPPEAPGSTPIDKFLNVQIAAAGLSAAPEADRPTLIRRVAFATTGLPPTIAEVDAFLADPSPDAYARMVDRYLASPRYGEEQARHWLDLARYADTHGLHLDNERQMWLYRDWVVKAFNQNLPFDEFTTWQLAGDLLPEPTTDQLVATGFNRCNVTTAEGGAIDAEFAYRYAVERTSTVAQTWLGMTAGCAVCHDHKYDPLSMLEFYSLYAFFNNSADPAMDGNIDTTPPFIKAPTPEQKLAIDSALKAEADARNWLNAAASAVTYVDPATKSNAMPRVVRTVLFDDGLAPGMTSRSSTRNAVQWVADPEYAAASGRAVIHQASASDWNDTFEFQLRKLVVPTNATFEVWLRVDRRDVPGEVRVSSTKNQTVVYKPAPGGSGLVRQGAEAAGVAVRFDEWTRLLIPAADLGWTPGEVIGSITLGQTGGVVAWDIAAVIGEVDPKTDPLDSLTAWRKAIGTNVPPETPGELHDAIRAGPDKPLADDVAGKMQQFYLAVVARPTSPPLAGARSAWEAARQARFLADLAAPGTFIFRESPTLKDSFVMLRGQYDKPGQPVVPAVPAVFPGIDKPNPETRLNRLDLAKWLLSPEHPLTARVAVNRMWQQIFGVGLVKTSFDFGVQGTPPSHPELLDWLANDYRDHGWDTRRFIRQILMTDAFRRSSVRNEKQLHVDPANRLLSVGPRLRLDAEQVRDNALFVSGLINLQMGGRGVRPYQPPNIWEPVGYADSNTRFYLQDHGPALYRRSLYTFLKRTAPPPFMSNFDAPNREQACSVRERGNTPLQALQLLNDTQQFEAARVLAERIHAEGGADDGSRITFAYRTVLSRSPTAEELDLVQHALVTQRELYAKDPSAAEAAIRVGESIPTTSVPAPELAAWTLVANLVLNLDETLMRN
jgi:mono/diheme cytochrome c family protein